jgi:hypothetical protein
LLLQLRDKSVLQEFEMSDTTTIQEFPRVFSNVAVIVLSLGLLVGVLNKLIV